MPSGVCVLRAHAVLTLYTTLGTVYSPLHALRSSGRGGARDRARDLLQDEEIPYGDMILGKLTAMHWRHIGRAEGRNDLREELRAAITDADALAKVATSIARNEPPF